MGVQLRPSKLIVRCCTLPAGPHFDYILSVVVPKMCGQLTYLLVRFGCAHHLPHDYAFSLVHGNIRAACSHQYLPGLASAPPHTPHSTLLWNAILDSLSRIHLPLDVAVHVQMKTCQKMCMYSHATFPPLNPCSFVIRNRNASSTRRNAPAEFLLYREQSVSEP